MKLLFDDKEIQKSATSLTEAGLVNNSKIDVVIEDEATPKPREEQVVVQAASVEEEPKNSREDWATKDILPKAPKDDLLMEPDYLQMCRMTPSELKSVKDLKFSNKFGSI